VSEPRPPGVGRWVGMGEVIKRMLLATVAAAVGIGGVAAVIGSILFLVGMFPTGGYSMIRGTITRRRPIGARQEPVFLLGLVLVGLGVVVDLTRPF